MTNDYWQPYSPTVQQPWNAPRAAHLHRRTVFGATWGEMQRDLGSKPQDAVSRVLSGEVRQDGVPDEFNSISELIATSAAEQPNAQRLKASWLYRILFTPDPLRERLTMMWHCHFATSNLKVNNLALMKKQNDTFRENAAGRFDVLLRSMLRDPAMLVWLDAPSNRTGHANENLGREVMELFTLGIGNYSETDVKNAARALTGLTVKENRFLFDPHRHDDGEKTILQKTGRFGPEQLADVLLQNPATPQRLAGRLIGEFFSEGVVAKAAHDELSDQLAETKLDIGKAVETILRSQLFFSDPNINSRISDPLSFLIAPLRALELFEPPPSTIGLSEWLRRMGLDLYYPPNVAGWPGGRSWLTTRTVIARANYAAAIVHGEVHRPKAIPVLEDLARKYNATSADQFEDMMRTLLLGGASERVTSRAAEADTHSREANLVLSLLTGTRAHLH